MCVGRMGATAIDSPHRRRWFFLVGVVPSTPWRIDVFFRCIVVFFMRFLEHWCVCGRCFFVLSNIVNYRKKILYSSTNCDSKNASPILVENPRSLRGSLKTTTRSQKKMLQVLRTRGSNMLFLFS